MIIALFLFLFTAWEAMAFEPINHLITTKAIQGKEGGFYPQDLLIGFQKGTVSFHTLTQVILDKGDHQFTMSILSPDKLVIVTKKLPVVKAQHDNWAETLWVVWNNVKFTQSGKHEFVLYLNNKAVARYYFIVS
jgi:hypothetical protein